MNATPARLVIAFVGVAILGSLTIIGILAIRQLPIPSEVATIPTAGLTGLLGLLINTRSSSEPIEVDATVTQRR